MAPESIKFDRAVDFYDQTRGFPPGIEAQVSALIAQVGRFTPASRTLEIVVGTGRIALPMSPHVAAIVGVDLSRPMMERLRAKQQAERIWLAEADAGRLPFPPASFGGAVAVHVFHLIPAWREVLAEVARVLKPGAPLVVARNEDRLDKMWLKLQESDMKVGLPNVGVKEEERDTFITDAGWKPLAEPQEVTWEVPYRPGSLIESIMGRSSSSTWRMTDEQLQQYADAVKQVLVEHYPDLNAEYPRPHVFKAQAFLPPV